MTTEESAIERFQDEPYFEVLVQSITRKAAQYAYAKIKCNKTLGATLFPNSKFLPNLVPNK